MKYYAYETQFAGPTDTKGARIRTRQIGLKKLTAISYDYGYDSYDNHQRAALATHCRLAGEDLEVLSMKDLDRGYLIIGVVR